MHYTILFEVENYGNFSNRYHVGSIQNYLFSLCIVVSRLLRNQFLKLKIQYWLGLITLDFAIASLVFWAFSCGIMFGNSNPFIGEFNFVAMNSYPELNPTIPSYANVMFHGAFVRATAAVVSGAMLERVNFKSFLIYSTIISGFVDPVVGHWAWSEHGWLYQLGFHDFAGSSSVHGLGSGIIALVGRCYHWSTYCQIRQKTKNQRDACALSRLAGMGTFVLWFGWFAFNACSYIVAIRYYGSCI